MVDSKMVLTGQTIAYTIYCIVIILLSCLVFLESNRQRQGKRS